GRYVAEGTIMGNQHDKSGFWFANGKEPGIVYIRKDVLERNIQTLIVDYDKPFSEQSAEAVLSIGKEGLEGGVNQAIINFVKGDDAKIQDGDKHSEVQVAPHRMVVNHDVAPERNRDGEPAGRGGTESRRGKRLEEDLLAETTGAAPDSKAKKGDDEGRASFFSSSASIQADLAAGHSRQELERNSNPTQAEKPASSASFSTSALFRN
ncbi:MAG: hypothetical protein ACK5Y6_05705, partial [Pseudomonadota bacterium]